MAGIHLMNRQNRPQRMRLLVALDALLTERNVTRAAERLHLSQPATSSALARLRELLDDPLLVRSGRQMVLTPRAAELLPGLKDVLTRVDRLIGRQRDFAPAGLSRRFTIAVSDSVGQILMPAVVERLRREAPGVALRLSAAPPLVPERELGSGALDMVVAHHEAIPEGLRSSTLYVHRLVAVVRRDHPHIRSRLGLRQFVTAPHVVVFPHAASIDDEMRRVFGRAGQAFEQMAATQSPAAAAAIVARTNGLALLNEPVARLYADAFGLRVLALPAGIEVPAVAVRAIWHERSQHDSASAWLREVLRECAK